MEIPTALAAAEASAATTASASYNHNVVVSYPSSSLIANENDHPYANGGVSGVATMSFDDDDEYAFARRNRCHISCSRLRSFLTATSMAFCLSLVTLMIGVSLFIFSSQRTREVQVPQAEPTLLLDQNATKEYWLRLKSEVLSPQQVLIPGSPVWKALQWMTVKDPRRPLPSGWEATQRYALAASFYRWSGDSGWKMIEEDGWIQAGVGLVEHECDWAGVQCNEEKQVTSLLLDAEQTAFELNGRIPSELGLLTSLQELDISGHDLKGIIPTELGALGPSLKSLYASENRLTGFDEKLMSQLSSLEILYLGSNILQGTLPTTMVNLKQLRVMDVSNNPELGGDAFSMMTSWPNLQELEISTTNIGGTLPDEIGEMKHLESLGIEFCPITGTIPTTIGKCAALKDFSARNPIGKLSGFSGTIPTEIGEVTKLEVLSLATHLLNSTVPTQIGLLSSLHLLDLNRNDNMHGTLPTELGLLSSTLEQLRVSDTAMTGTLPTEMVLLTNLKALHVADSGINGPALGLCKVNFFGDEFVVSCSVDRKTKQLDDCPCCKCRGY